MRALEVMLYKTKPVDSGARVWLWTLESMCCYCRLPLRSSLEAEVMKRQELYCRTFFPHKATLVVHYVSTETNLRQFKGATPAMLPIVKVTRS